MKVAVITDTHFGVRSDSPAMYTAMRKFYEQVFFPTLDAHSITRVLHGGDYGDRRKYINFATARFIDEVYRQPLKDRGIREDVIIGNHDCFYRDSAELNSVQELYRHDDSIHIYTQPTEITIDGCDILLLPWICDSNRDATLDAIATSTAPVVLGHLELSGFQMYRGMPSHDGMDPNLFERFKLVMSGHFHHRSQSGPIQYLGAPYAMVWSDYRDPRGFHLFDTETHELEFIPNPFTVFGRIVYDDADQPNHYIEQLVSRVLAPDSEFHDAYVKIVVKSKTQPYWFDLLMDALGKVNTQDIMIVDDIVAAGTTDEPDPSTDVDTLTLMTDYIDGLTLSCDKQALQSYLQSLYHEAVSTTHSARVS
jgi:DNA repair exonuclease SbcCD nuclease subunit